jgi:sphinganine-1-phosphate aldolase
LVNRGKKTIFKLARKIPAISQRIEREMKKINEAFEQEVIHRNQGNPYITTLPKEGKSSHDIIQQVERYLSFGKLLDYKIRKSVLFEGSLYCV